jgi:hypothetical protein
MSTYLLIWNLNPNYISEEPAKRAKQWQQLMKMIDEDMKRGVLKSWGSFIAEGGGYSLMEGSELDVSVMAQQYVPYVEFETHACATFEQTKQLLEAMAGR